MPHAHWDGGPTCSFRTKKKCDEAYANFQAKEQVKLAAYVIAKGEANRYTKDTSVFGQLVQVMAGTRETITNSDVVESEAPFTRRVLTALADFRKDPINAVPEWRASE